MIPQTRTRTHTQRRGNKWMVGTYMRWILFQETHITICQCFKALANKMMQLGTYKEIGYCIPIAVLTVATLDDAQNMKLGPNWSLYGLMAFKTTLKSFLLSKHPREKHPKSTPLQRRAATNWDKSCWHDTFKSLGFPRCTNIIYTGKSCWFLATWGADQAELVVWMNKFPSKLQELAWVDNSGNIFLRAWFIFLLSMLSQNYRNIILYDYRNSIF